LLLSAHQPPEIDDTTAPPRTGVAAGEFNGKCLLARRILAKFKPKCAAQSPSAPANWMRCRTRALCLQKSGGKLNLCPLDLCPQDESSVRNTPPGNQHPPLGESWKDAKKVIEDHTADLIVRSELMLLLKRLQLEMNPLGPIKVELKGSQDYWEKFSIILP